MVFGTPRSTAWTAWRSSRSKRSSSRNDLVRTGWFESSSAELNRLHENVVWGMRGNFVSIPTDCPQRDERLGWTGDIQVFSPAASSLFDCAGFLSSWLADLAAEQGPDGSVPLVVPDVLPRGPSIAVWGDAACVVPWVLYERFGDRGILATQWESMRALGGLRSVSCRATTSFGAGSSSSGDWLDPTAPPDNPAAAKADPDVIATACFASSAEILSRDGDRPWRCGGGRALWFSGGAGSGRRSPITTSRRPGESSPTRRRFTRWPSPGRCCRPSAERAGAGRRLADLVRLSGHRISTGFRGHAAHPRRAGRERLHGHRLPPALPARRPVVALCGVNGSDDGLGTLGQHAARRFDQPGRDDVVQPLRPREQWRTSCTGWWPGSHR